MANKFTNFKFTTEGKDTLTEVLAAKGSIAITQVYTFASNLTDALVFTQLSSLSPKQIKPVGTVSAQSNTVETRLQIDNADLTADYNLQGIALVGTFNKTNFVLGYINTNEATNVPAFSGNQVQTISLDVSFAISDTSVITINTQTAGMLTVADYNALVAYIKDQVAPLSVDKKVVHLTNNEIIDGIKTFKQKITGSISGNANTVDYINIHQITANIDLNTLTTNGNYLSTLETKTTSNKPGGTSEQYTLISTGNIQVFNDIKTDKTYIRNYIKSDTFTSWKVVIEDIDQTLNAQFNFTKVPTVNSKPVAIQADLQTETTNRTNADKTINNSLATEVSDRKSGDATNANAVQAEATARSQADSSAAAALNTEKATRSAVDTSLSNSLASEASARSAADVWLTNQFNTVNSGLNNESAARSAADETLTRAVSDTQTNLQTETTNRTNNDNRIDGAAVHKTGNESISGVKTFSDTTKFSKQIEGSFSNRTAPFSELSDLITKMATYAGQWRIYTGQVSGLPIGDNQWGVMEVIPYNNSEDGGLLLLYGLKTMDAYIGYTSGSAVQWEKIANDALVAHLDNAETFTGKKTFSAGISTTNIDVSGTTNLTTLDVTYPISGSLGVKTATFADFAVVAKNMKQYSGRWLALPSNAILNGPTGTINFNAYIEVTYTWSDAGIITVSNQGSNTWIGTVSSGVIRKWTLVANNSEVVQKSGDTMTGALTVGGNPLTGGSGTYIGNNGSIELGASTAFIDFHGGNSSDDYSSRMYDSGDGLGNKIVDKSGFKTLSTPLLANSTNKYNLDTVAYGSMVLTGYSHKVIVSVRTNLLGTSPDTQNGDGTTNILDNVVITWERGYNEKYGIQTITNLWESMTWQRSMRNGVFQPWMQIITSSNIGSQSVTAAGKLTTPRTIGGVLFDGTSNINLPGVNTQGNQSTTGNAASASKLLTARTIGGVSFDGTANINLPGVNTAGNQNTSGKAATAGRADTAAKADSATTANDPNALHQSGNESASGTKTFTGTLVANNPIQGTIIRNNILDGYDLNGYKDTGDFVINGVNNLVNYPNNAYNYAVLHVEKLSNGTSIQTLTTADNAIYTRIYGGNPANFANWVSVANDSNVVHKTGNESIGGNKIFTGTVTAGGTQLTDSGWKSLTLSVGGSVKYRKINGIVYVKGDSIPALNNENKTMTTLPAGYRPYDTIWFPWYAGSSMGNLNIKSDGTILKASSNNQGNDQVQMSFFISYPADN